jgi:hypothetical protein
MGMLFWGKIDTKGKTEGILRSMVSTKSSNCPQDEAAFVGSLLQLLPQYLASDFAPLSQTNIGICDHRQERETPLPLAEYHKNVIRFRSALAPKFSWSLGEKIFSKQV